MSHHSPENGNVMADYDAIVIGAGHNGLTAANVLSKAARVCSCSSAPDSSGGWPRRGSVRRFKHSVGAWAVLVWSELMTERLELDPVDFELVEQWSSACTFGEPNDTPFVMYNDPERMARHMLEDHSADVAMRMG